MDLQTSEGDDQSDLKASIGSRSSRQRGWRALTDTAKVTASLSDLRELLDVPGRAARLYCCASSEITGCVGLIITAGWVQV